MNEELLHDEAPPEVEDILQQVPAIPADWREKLTDEQFAKIKEKMSKLLGKDNHIRFTCMVLIAARQLYNLGRFALARDMDLRGYKPEDGVQACLEDAMADASMREYTRTKVRDKMTNFVLPFLAAEIQQEMEELKKSEQTNDEKVKQWAEKFRVPIGFPVAKDGLSSLDRSRSLILVGPIKAVKYIMDQAQNHLITTTGKNSQTPRQSVIRFSDQVSIPQNATRKGSTDQQLVCIPSSQWIAKADTGKGFDKFVTPWNRRCCHEHADLLIFDDLSMMQKEILTDAPPQRNAAAAQKFIRRWADNHGCAVMAAINISDPVFDREEDAWSTLEVHSDLLFVDVVVEGDVAHLRLYKPWEGKDSVFHAFHVDPKLIK